MLLFGLPNDVMLRISFGLAALFLEIVLVFLHIFLGYGQNKNSKFRSLIVIVIIGNLISMTDNLLRVSKIAAVPNAAVLAIRLISLLCNVILSIYVYSYVRTLLTDEKVFGKGLDIVNNLIVLGSVLTAATIYIIAMINSFPEVSKAIPGAVRVIIGYLVEVYFLLLSLLFVVKCRKKFERRAFYTAAGAFAVIIFAMLLQFLQSKTGILLSYFGATIGTYIFYVGVEIPAYGLLKESLDVVHTLAEAIDAKDPYTKGHSSRVALYAKEIARRAGMPERQQDTIYMLGLLHDVGKIGVPDSVINKPGKLTDEEYDAMKKHPVIGAKILENIKESPRLAVGARWHHERLDGKGYPDGLTGDDIPLEARIIAVADAYDAMSSNRRYRARMEQQHICEQIETGKGTQFDEKFADIMLQMIAEDTEYKLRDN